MRIGLDGSSLLGERTGIGRYCLNLLKAWPSTEDRFEILSVSARRRPALDLKNVAPTLTWHHRSVPGKLAYLSWSTLSRPAIEGLLPPLDVFFSPNYFIFPTRTTPQIITVHDLYFLDHPDQAERFGGRLWARSLRRDLDRVAAIIAVSERTREDLLGHFTIDPARIQVIPEAADPHLAQALTAENLAAHLGPLGLSAGRYLLWVGTTEPRKNLPRLVEAYGAARQAHPDIPPLVLVGRPGPDEARIADLLQASRDLSDSVRRLGYVSDASLAALYQGARAFIYPSLHEGFGLPILEAMVSGCPVVTSRRGASREVAGEAALFVDPLDLLDLKRAIEVVSFDEDLREDLRRRGERQARRFSWERAARATREVLAAAATVDHR